MTAIRQIPPQGIFIDEDIETDLLSYVGERLLHLEKQKNSVPICVYINTDGGDLYTALGIYDLLKSSKKKICTIGVGSVCSAGILILGATELKNRYMTRNSVLMIHDLQDAFPSMDIRDLRTNMKETERVRQKLCEVLTDILGYNASPLLKKRVDLYYDAEKAIKEGIVGGIWRE